MTVEVRVEVEDPTTWPDRDGCTFPAGTAVVIFETVRYPSEDSRAVTAEVARRVAGLLDAVIGGSPTYHRVGVNGVLDPVNRLAALLFERRQVWDVAEAEGAVVPPGVRRQHRVVVDGTPWWVGHLVVRSGGLADALELTRVRPAVLIGTERCDDTADADVDRLLSSLTARDTHQHVFRSTALAAVRPGRFVMRADDTADGVAVFGFVHPPRPGRDRDVSSVNGTRARPRSARRCAR